MALIWIDIDLRVVATEILGEEGGRESAKLVKYTLAKIKIRPGGRARLRRKCNPRKKWETFDKYGQGYGCSTTFRKNE